MRALVQPDGVTGYRLTPGVVRRFAGMYSRLERPVLWQVNAQGLRDDRLRAASARRFRIATYGDSETFGWSVELSDTFQREMERIDPRVEVLNFGVPGYNVSDVARHLERTLPEFAPDLAIYLVHKNDFDDPVRVSHLVAGSSLLARLRLFYHFTLAKPERIRRRHSPERRSVFLAEVERMARVCESRGIPLVLALLHRAPVAAVDGLASRLQIVEAGPVIGGFPKQDAHLTAPAHRALAARLCAAVSGRPQACRPPDASALVAARRLGRTP
jgi:hypothetical protein